MWLFVGVGQLFLNIIAPCDISRKKKTKRVKYHKVTEEQNLNIIFKSI